MFRTDKNFNRVMVLASSMLVAACGGGGGDSTAAPQSNDAALTGTWIYSSDSHPTGGSCGLDLHGAWGERITLTFNGSSYTAKSEACISLTGGNTGAYVQNNTGSGTYSTGGLFLNGGSPALNMYSIDFMASPTFYSAYNITGNQLKLGVATAQNDGTTAAKRAYTYSVLDPVFTKQ